MQVIVMVFFFSINRTTLLIVSALELAHTLVKNLQVDGNLTVLGTQTAVSTADVTAGSPFFRLNEGNAIGEAGTTYQGTGVDDAFFSGFMKGPSPQTYYVRIDGKEQDLVESIHSRLRLETTVSLLVHT